MPDDRLAAAVAELYGAAPEAFTERRGELAAAARGDGDRAAAKAIAALRRPTRAAWVVNRLARADPSAAPKLAELAAALRAAQEARQGLRLRELSAARGALVDALTAQALAAAGVPDPPVALRSEVAETLTAALADPQVAAAFAAGTLTRAVQWSGFGVLPSEPDGAEPDGAEPDGAEPDGAEPDGARRDGAEPGGRGVAGAAGQPSARVVHGDGGSARGDAGARGSRRSGDTPAGGTAKAGGTREAGGTARSRRARAALATPAPAPTPAGAARREAEAARQAEAAERLAREAEERAARRREQYEDAERLVAATSTAAAEAVSAEDRLEAEVRDLEQRLTRARADLAAARMRARHAEAAERRARQALDRLPE